MITPDQGVVIAGRYTLVRQLAKGGMGSVWIARHRDLEIDVTVKFMAPSLVASAEARMRFEREAKLAARLRSQHVVQVHDYGVEDETPYIIMELLKGESLSDRITRDGRLAPRIVAPLVVQICKALRTAHESGLVHRDLKPGNIFLALKDEDEVVKVLDFGIAKSGSIGEAQADTASGVLLGSVHYMSPEQIRSSRAVDHRSDLWSIAVILYRVLTGRLPFPGSNLGDVLVRVCTDATPPASQASPDLPARIDRFFERALARDPAQRFQTATELSEAFSSMALDPPAQTPPPQGPTPRQTTRIPQDAPAPRGEVDRASDATLPLPEPAAPSPPIPAPAAPPPQLSTKTVPLLPVPLQAAPPPPVSAPAAPPPPVPLPAAPPPPVLAPAAPPPPFPAQANPSLPTITAGARTRKHSSWPVWAAIAAVAVAAILGIALRSRAVATDTGNAAPSAAPPITTAEVTAVLPAPREAPPTPQPTPTATAARDDVGATASAKAAADEPQPALKAAPDRATPPAPKAAPDPAAQPKIAPKRKTNPLDRSD